MKIARSIGGKTTRSRRLEILVQVKTARSRSENQVKSARSTGVEITYLKSESDFYSLSLKSPFPLVPPLS